MPRTTPINKAANNVSLVEVGGTGLTQYSGLVYEEQLRQLTGSKARKVFREMSENDPAVGAVLFAIDKLIRNVEWNVEPADDSPQAQEAADFVRECKDDMEHTWQEFISEAMSMLTFGFAPHELVYKLRGGYNHSDKSKYSKFNDNKIGWRKLPIRAQESLFRWHFDENNDVTAMEQYIIGKNKNPIIPMDKMLLFRTESRKNNPEGRSILRNAFRPWFFKKRIEEIEGIGIERDLAGLPVAYVPPRLLGKDATPEEKATLSVIKKMITNIRRDEQEGIVFPLMYDEVSGKEIFKLELLSTGGTRQFDTSKIIDRYDRRIAMTVLADFLFLGQSKVGSFALSSDKTDLFSLAIGAWLGDIAAVLNRKAVKDLMILNNIDLRVAPSFKPSDLEKNDLAKFADAIYKLVGVGALLVDEDVDNAIRTNLNLPPRKGDASSILPTNDTGFGGFGGQGARVGDGNGKKQQE